MNFTDQLLMEKQFMNKARISFIRFEDLLIKGPPIIKFSGTPELL